jgi:DNA-binding transcriptional LysR family regulator
MTIELRALRHLIAIEEHGSFGRAAIALGMTQPALSRSIQGLEHQVGAALLARSKRGVTLTDEGAVLLRRARQVVQAADELDREVRRRRIPGTDQVTVGAGPYPGETLVATAAARFLSTHPLVRVRVLVRSSEELVPQLRARGVDSFVAETSVLESELDLDIEPLIPHPTYFVARAGHPLAAREAVRPEDVFAYPFAALSRLPPRVLQPLLEARPGRTGPPSRPFPALELDHLAAVKRVLQSSDAIAGLSLACVADELERGTLVLLGRESWMSLGYGIVRLKGRAPSDAATAFCEAIRAAEAELVREEAALLARHSPAREAPAKRRRAKR